jgi:hypothetical protein
VQLIPYSAHNVEVLVLFAFMPIYLVVRGAKKTGVLEYVYVLNHAGLLVNEPPGRCRIAPHLVVRRLSFGFYPSQLLVKNRLTFFEYCNAK